MADLNLEERIGEIVGRKLSTFREEMAANQRAAVQSQVDAAFAVSRGASGGSASPAAAIECARAALFMTAIAATRCRGGEVAADWAKRKFGDNPELQRALGESTAPGGGILVPADVRNEITAALRARTLVRKMGARVLPMPRGTLTLPKFKTGTSANYTGENRKITASEPTFEALTLRARKLTALVASANELIEDSPMAAAEEIRNDVIEANRVREDLAFIRGAGTENSPKGIENWVDASNLVPWSGSITVDTVTDFLGEMLQALEDQNIPFVNLGWIIEPRTKRYLMALRTTQGPYAFRDEMLKGELLGFPFGVTTQLPRNLGSGSNETKVLLADFGHLRIGETGDMRLDMADNVSYTGTDGATHSAFEEDQTAVRMITRHDIGPKYLGKEIAVGTGVTWGA